MNSSSALKHAITSSVRHFIDMANEKYDMSMDYPTVDFTVKGSNGGTAHGGKWRVNFNMVLIVDNMNEYLNQVVPHEVAHLVVHARHGVEYKNTRRGMVRVSHGKNFYSVMRVFGVQETRCHKMDVSKVKTSRNAKKYGVKCPCCQDEFTVGTVRMKKIMNGTRYMHRCEGRKATDPIFLI